MTTGRRLGALAVAAALVLSVVGPSIGFVGVVRAGNVAGCTTISTSGTHGLTGDVSDAAPSSGNSCISITADDVALEGNGYTVDGTDNMGVDEYGIRISGENVTIRNLTISDWSENGIYVTNTDNVTIEGTDFASNFHAVWMKNSTNVTVTAATATSSGDDAIVIRESATFDVRNVSFVGTDGRGVWSDNSSYGVVENTTSQGDGGGVLLDRGSHATVSNNTFDGGSIHLLDVTNSTVSRNDVRNASVGVYVQQNTYPSRDVLVADNTLVDNTEGVKIQESQNVTVRNNTLRRNEKGMLLYGPTIPIVNATIEDNRILNSTDFGIKLWGDGGTVRDGLLRNNTVRNNGDRGIVFLDATNVTMRDNTISGHAIDFELGETEDSDHSIEHFRHDIDTSNTVDGHPIGYYRNASGVTIGPASSTDSVIVVDSTDVTLTDRTLSNSSIVFANATDSRIENVTVHGTGLQILYSKNLTVDDADLRPTRLPIQGDWAFGLYAMYDRNVTVSDSVVVETPTFTPALSGVQVGETVDQTTDGVTIRNLTTQITHQGIWLRSGNGTRIVNSTLSDGSYGVSTLSHATNTTIRNVTAANNTGHGIEIEASETMIRASNFSGNGMVGILVDGPDTTLRNNRIHDNGEQGVLTQSLALRATVVGNDVRGNGLAGIYLEGVTSPPAAHVAADNVVADNGESGIVVEGEDIVLRNNTVSGHTAHGDDAGIRTRFGDVQNLSIVGGTVENNSYGVYLGGDDGNDAPDLVTIEGTTVRNNTIGARLRFATNTTFRNTTFTQNVEWAYRSIDTGGFTTTTATNVAIGDVTVDWTAHEVAIAPAGTLPTLPANDVNVTAPLNVSNTTSRGYANLTIHYTDADVSTTGVNESTIGLVRHDGGTWIPPSGSNTLDVVANTVSANVTPGGIIAPVGELSAPGPVGSPELTVSPSGVDFGDVTVGSSNDSDVTVTNDGNAPLSVTGTTLGGADAGQFGVSNGGSFTLAPAASRTLSVTYAPTANASHAATLSIASNDTDEPSIVVDLAGTGLAPAQTPTPTPTPTPSAGNGGGDDDSGGGPSTSSPVNVDVTPAGTGQMDVSVENANAGDAVSIDSNDREIGGVTLDSIDLVPAVDGDFTLTVGLSETAPPGAPIDAPTGDTPLSYLTVDHSIADEDVEAVTFEFHVDRTVLADRGLEPSDVVIYRYHDGSWQPASMTVADETTTHHVFEATVPGLSVFAVGSGASARTTPAPTGTATSVRTETGTIAHTDTPGPTNMGTGPETTESTTTGGQPGFPPAIGVIVVLLVLGGAGLVVHRR